MDPLPLCIGFLINSAGAVTGLTVAIIALILMSAFFSLSEAAYLSCNRIRLKAMEGNGSKRAAKILKQLDNFEKIINTITICNNVVNLTAASLSTILFALLIKNQSIATAVSTVVLTFLVIVFGEIIPKSVGKEKPESIAFFAQPVLAFLTLLLTPLVWVFGLWRKIRKPEAAKTITDDELITFVEEAENDGGLDSHESRLIKSAIEFDDVELYEVMIPRVDTAFVKDTDSAESIAQLFYETGFSRLPVYHDSPDAIIGILHEKDFYAAQREQRDIFSVIKSTICLSRNMKISAALRVFQKAKTHMAVVVDEFGGTSGIVTMEDILEELVGEIYDEHDEEEVLFHREGDGTFIVAGSENLDDMFDGIGIPLKEEFDSASVGGWVTEQMQRIPNVGEKFTYQNIEITVTKASPRKVIEIKAFVKPEPSFEQSN